VWKKQGSVTVTSVSLPFFKDLVSSVTAGTYTSDSTTFKSIVDAVWAYADGFMDVNAKYTASDGSIPEQFDRNTGTPIGATHLTWSYAAFITAAERRAGIIPDGWGAENAKNVPSSCNRNQVAGSYTSATKTTFPTSQTPQASVTSSVSATASATVTTPGASTGTASSSSAAATATYACATPNVVQVTFNEKVTTTFGQTIKIVGSIAELGSWNTAYAVALSATQYTSSNPLWYVTVALPANTAFEYKFINVGTDGTVKWESNPNRAYTVPAGAQPVTGCDGTGACVTATQDTTWR
jgi:glucoamylase